MIGLIHSHSLALSCTGTAFSSQPLRLAAGLPKLVYGRPGPLRIGLWVGLKLWPCPVQRVPGWVVIHFLLLDQSVNQQTLIPLRPHVLCAGPRGNRSESELVPGLRVGEELCRENCQVEGLWKSEQSSSPIVGIREGCLEVADNE